MLSQASPCAHANGYYVFLSPWQRKVGGLLVYWLTAPGSTRPKGGPKFEEGTDRNLTAPWEGYHRTDGHILKLPHPHHCLHRSAGPNHNWKVDRHVSGRFCLLLSRASAAHQSMPLWRGSAGEKKVPGRPYPPAPHPQAKHMPSCWLEPLHQRERNCQQALRPRSLPEACLALAFLGTMGN